MKLKIFKKVYILLYIMMMVLLSSIVFAGQASPVVSLGPPTDATETYNQTINMTCNASWSDANLINFSLYINGTFNVTNTTAVTNNTDYVFLNIPFGVGSYYWNCLAEDNNTNLSWAPSNFTLNVNLCTYECTVFSSCEPNSTGGHQNCTTVNETVECVYAGDYTEFQEWCNYCTLTEEISRGNCINDSHRVNTYLLTNNATCCTLTGNNTDCTVTDSYNSTCGYAQQYDAGEVAEVSVDMIIGVGAAFFSFVTIIALVFLYVWMKKRV